MEEQKPHSTQELVEIIDHDLRKGGWVEQDGERWRVNEAGLVALQSLVEQLETARRHRLALAEWIVKNQPETTWSEEVQELAILLNDEHGKVFELQEQLEAAQRVVDAARIVSETEATGTLPDFQSLADALARYPAKSPDGAGSLVRSQSDEWTRSSTPPPPPREDSNQERKPD